MPDAGSKKSLVSARASPKVAIWTLGFGLWMLAACGARTELLPGDVLGAGGREAFSDASTPDAGEPEKTDTCQDGRVQIDVDVPVLLFVVDTSGSMRYAPGCVPETDCGGGPSKWEITARELSGAIQSLPDHMAVGLSYFPNPLASGNLGSCYTGDIAVPIEQLGSDDQRGRFETSLAAVSPDGFTPTQWALRTGALIASEYAGGDQRVVVLITDGRPTRDIDCRDLALDQPIRAEPLVAEANAARELGVRTLVIGSPGSEDAREALSRMALAGGTGSDNCSHSGPDFCHVDMTIQDDFAQALAGTLRDVDRRAICEFNVPPDPELDLTEVDFRITDAAGGERSLEQVEDSTACAGDDGWHFSEDLTRAVLCDTTCDSFAEERSTGIRVVFPCAEPDS